MLGRLTFQRDGQEKWYGSCETNSHTALQLMTNSLLNHQATGKVKETDAKRITFMTSPETMLHYFRRSIKARLIQDDEKRIDKGEPPKYSEWHRVFDDSRLNEDSMQAAIDEMENLEFVIDIKPKQGALDPFKIGSIGGRSPTFDTYD